MSRRSVVTTRAAGSRGRGAVPAAVPAGARTCVECGRVDGPRGHDCLAHPRHPGMGTMVSAFFFCPLILVPIVGWDALLAFLPWFLFAWWVKTR